jgi:SET domain
MCASSRESDLYFKSKDVTDLSDPMYKICEIPGKGFGAIATRDIAPGELLMEEKPLFAINTRKAWFTPSESYSETRVENEVDKLSDEDRERFYALHGFIGHNEELERSAESTADSIDSNDEGEFPQQQEKKRNLKLQISPIIIYRTNAYPAGGGKSGIFPLISRLNSHCTPNVHYSWNEKRNKSTIYSVTNILKGEEIVNCYIGLYIIRLERMKYLWKNFGFSCSCKTCGLTGPAQEESDKRRLALESYEEMTVTAILEKKKNLALDLVSVRLETLIDEGLSNSITLFKCEYDAFLAVVCPFSSTSSLVDDISSSADCTNTTESNGEMLDVSSLDDADRLEAKEWLEKAYQHVVEAKGPESIEAQKCFYYLSIISLQ